MVQRTKQSHHKRSIDEHLLIAYLLSLVFGLVVVYSTSSMIAESRFGSHYYFFFRQLIWAFLSVIAMIFICRLDLKRYAVISAPAYLLTLGLLGMVFIMTPYNGAHRWLQLGSITVQPSEFFKVVMVYYLAFSLSNRNRDIRNTKEIIIRYVPLIGAALALILLEPDLGTTIVVFITACMMFFLAGARIKHLLMAAIPLTATAVFLVFGLGYKKARVIDYLAAIVDPLKGSYQAKQAALTLGAGGIFGIGLGEGRQKLFFLPYPHTDFVFAAAGEELGLVGLLMFLGLMFYMIIRGLKIASRQPDKFGYLLASGMTLSLFINVAINVGVVTSLLPVTGLPLPFMSYGGSSLLISSAAVAVLLNLSRRMES